MSTGVVITGVGSVSPFGIGVSALRDGLRCGRDPVEPLWQSAGYRVNAGYTVPDAGEVSADLARPLRLAATAAAEAVDDSGLSLPIVAQAGLALASTSAGWHMAATTLDPTTVVERSERTSIAYEKEGPAVELCRTWRLSGPVAVFSSACAASTGAVAWSVERIRHGDAVLMLVGGVDVLTEIVYLGFHSMRLLGRRTRPFSRLREGFVLAEGAAFVILEDEEHALARERTPYAAVTGWGASADARHVTTPSASGITHSLRLALSDAQVLPEDLAMYHAHGTSSPTSDQAEHSALSALLGTRLSRLPVTANKATLGHTEGTAGMFSIVSAAIAIADECVPHRAPDREPETDPPGLQLLTADRAGRCAPAVVHASGFGGVNCSVVLDSLPHSRPAPRPLRHVAVRVAAVAHEREVEVIPLQMPDTHETQSTPSRCPPDPLEPAWPAAPQPDSQCQRVAAVVGAVLNSVQLDIRSAVLEGGLVSGTRYGAQAHHLRMQTVARSGGPRHIDPVDFALSTFNQPAALVGAAFGVTGQIETFLGVTAGVEALLTAVHLVAARRADAALAVAYDSPENRIWRYTDDAPVPNSAVALIVDAGQEPGLIEIAGLRRLPVMLPGALVAKQISGAVKTLDPRGESKVWIDLADLSAAQVSLLRSLLPQGRLLKSDAGAAAPVRWHVEAMEELAAKPPGSLIMVSAGHNAPTLLVCYRRGHG